MSYLDEYNNNVSLKILMEFLKDYINTDKESDNIKFAKSLIDESDLENINKVIDYYHEFYKNYNSYYLGGQLKLDIEDIITKDNFEFVDNKCLSFGDCCNSAEYFSCLNAISKYGDFKKLVDIYIKFSKHINGNKN